MVALAVLLDGVFGRERDARHDDNHHDERFEEREGHDPVDENPHPAKMRTFSLSRFRSFLFFLYHLRIRRGENEH